MSMIDRFRSHRQSVRRERAIERAIRSANSPAVQEEIRAMVQRQWR
jgi:hypothetical protein